MLYIVNRILFLKDMKISKHATYNNRFGTVKIGLIRESTEIQHKLKTIFYKHIVTWITFQTYCAFVEFYCCFDSSMYNNNISLA